LMVDFPTVPDHRSNLALGLHNMGILLQNLGKKSAAESTYRRAVIILDAIVKEFPSVPDFRGRLADSSLNLGLSLKDRGDQSGDRVVRAACGRRLRPRPRGP